MSIEYRWEIESVRVQEKHENKDNVIKRAKFLLYGTRNDESAFIIGEVDLEFNADSFTAYEDVTQEMMIDWVKEALGPEQILSYEETVASQLPPEELVAKPLPWVAVEEAPEYDAEPEVEEADEEE